MYGRVRAHVNAHFDVILDIDALLILDAVHRDVKMVKSLDNIQLDRSAYIVSITP